MVLNDDREQFRDGRRWRRQPPETHEAQKEQTACGLPATQLPQRHSLAGAEKDRLRFDPVPGGLQSGQVQLQFPFGRG